MRTRQPAADAQPWWASYTKEEIGRASDRLGLLRSIARWIDTHRFKRSAEARLYTRQIFTVPSLAVASFAIAHAVMLYVSVRYQLNFGYLITFLGLTVLITAAWMSFLVLRGLRLHADPEAPACIAGDRTRFRIHISDLARINRKDLYVIAAGQEFEMSLGAGDSLTIEFDALAPSRGIVLAPVVKIGTHYPLGFWHTHHVWLPAQAAIAYPKPEVNPPPIVAGTSSEVDQGNGRAAGDVLASTRIYRPGDAPNRIAWKLFARSGNRTLFTKEAEPTGVSTVWIDEAAATAAGTVEARIARLAAWLMQAHASGQMFGLRAFGVQLEPAQGEAHFHACMKVLALAPGCHVGVARPVWES